MALITAAEAREHIPGIEGTGLDTNLDTLIAVIGQAFAGYCAVPAPSNGLNTLESATRIIYPYMDEEGDPRRLYLGLTSAFPVTSVTEVVEDDNLDYTDSADVVSSSLYTLVNGGRGWEIRLKSTGTKGAWSTVASSIRVTIVAGWSTVPAELKMAAKVAVRALYDQQTVQGVTRVGDRSFVDDPDILTPNARRLLAPFRQVAALMG